MIIPVKHPQQFILFIIFTLSITLGSHEYFSESLEALQLTNSTVPDAIVLKDGTGTYTSIAEAIVAAPSFSRKRHIIYIKRGLYHEYVVVGKNKWNLTLLGDGMDATIISGNRSTKDGWRTYTSGTFIVKGPGFIARDITFENTAGPEKGQAVAFCSDSEHSALYRCSFLGYQDTLYAHSSHQFYKECKITGTVDFLFGFGTVVFQNCLILTRKGLPNQHDTITANGRKRSIDNTGFSLQFCNISIEPDVLGSLNETYLGRPWKLYSRTIIMQSYISGAIRPEGWLEWNKSFALDTLYYAEYMNYGPGGRLQSRVKWPGYHILNDSSQANTFTVKQFIQGDMWLPSTGIPYIGGLH